jgi:hypothetical protein
MNRKFAVVLGTLAAMVSLGLHAGKDTLSDSGGNGSARQALEDSCHVVVNGRTIRGDVKVDFVKSGRVVIATVTEYRITSPASDRHKANIDINMRVWNGGQSTEIAQVKSSDSMRQDGQWHALNLSVGRDVGFDVTNAHFGAEFTFDLAGPDQKCRANHLEPTF